MKTKLLQQHIKRSDDLTRQIEQIQKEIKLEEKVYKVADGVLDILEPHLLEIGLKIVDFILLGSTVRIKAESTGKKFFFARVVNYDICVPRAKKMSQQISEKLGERVIFTQVDPLSLTTETGLEGTVIITLILRF